MLELLQIKNWLLLLLLLLLEIRENSLSPGRYTPNLRYTLNLLAFTANPSLKRRWKKTIVKSDVKLFCIRVLRVLLSLTKPNERLSYDTWTFYCHTGKACPFHPCTVLVSELWIHLKAFHYDVLAFFVSENTRAPKMPHQPNRFFCL